MAYMQIPREGTYVFYTPGPKGPRWIDLTYLVQGYKQRHGGLSPTIIAVEGADVLECLINEGGGLQLGMSPFSVSSDKAHGEICCHSRPLVVVQAAPDDGPVLRPPAPTRLCPQCRSLKARLAGVQEDDRGNTYTFECLRCLALWEEVDTTEDERVPHDSP
jgi:hypothetical protein